MPVGFSNESVIRFLSKYPHTKIVKQNHVHCDHGGLMGQVMRIFHGQQLHGIARGEEKWSCISKTTNMILKNYIDARKSHWLSAESFVLANDYIDNISGIYISWFSQLQLSFLSFCWVVIFKQLKRVNFQQRIITDSPSNLTLNNSTCICIPG